MSGTLSIYVVSDPLTGHGGVDPGDRYLNIDLDGPEWEALFFDVLSCPEPEPYNKGEKLGQYQSRLRSRFQQAITDLPMPGRIWDPYQDYGYTPEQVEQLRGGCLKVAASTNNPRALEGLRKLILACDEALKSRKGLFLVAD